MVNSLTGLFVDITFDKKVGKYKRKKMDDKTDEYEKQHWKKKSHYIPEHTKQSLFSPPNRVYSQHLFCFPIIVTSKITSGSNYHRRKS